VLLHIFLYIEVNVHLPITKDNAVIFKYPETMGNYTAHGIFRKLNDH